MSVLCAGDCHVWLGSSSLCTCEAHRVAMYGFPQNYNPFAPTRATPPTAADLPDVDVAVIAAAQLVRASHLSADGKRAYCERYGAILQAEWKGGEFGVWWPVKEWPADVVRL